MNKHKSIILVLSIILFCCYANAEVGIGEKKELIITKNVSVPLPDASWDWYVGNTITKENMQISIFWCQSADAKSKLVFIFFDEPIKESRKKFTEGLISGAVRKAEEKGFKFTKYKIEEKDIPWKGALHYSGLLTRKNEKIYLEGVIAFGKGIYAIQYQGNQKNPNFLQKVTKGMQNLDTPKQSKSKK